MVNAVDGLLSGIGDNLGGMWDDLVGNLAFGKSIKKVASKVKTGAKQYAASTPQGQAITAGQSAMKKQKSKGTKSVIPKPGKKGGRVSSWFSNLTETKIYGIPVLYAGLGTMFIGLPLLKKMGRKR